MLVYRIGILVLVKDLNSEAVIPAISWLSKKGNETTWTNVEANAYDFLSYLAAKQCKEVMGWNAFIFATWKDEE